MNLWLSHRSYSEHLTASPSETDETTGEILDSWDQIIASVNNGTYATKYAIGNYKPLDLGTEGVVNMQIAALDADVLSDGTGNAHITWIAKSVLTTPHSMNLVDGTSSNVDGWAVSGMRTYLSTDVWALIPEAVQDAIVPVDKTYYDYTTQSTLTCSDKVWIPSAREVGIYSNENSGVVYSELFTNNQSRIMKEANGDYAYWWLRSAATTDARFKYIVNSGSGSEASAYQAYYIVLGFCM